MLFNSLQFLIFFPLVALVYFLLRHRWRWLWLLIASCYFYMAFVPVYILILAFTIVVDYFAGMLIERSAGRNKKVFLLCSLVANIGVLCMFKYYNFINDNITALLGSLHYKTRFLIYPFYCLWAFLFILSRLSAISWKYIVVIRKLNGISVFTHCM